VFLRKLFKLFNNDVEEPPKSLYQIARNSTQPSADHA